MWYYNFLKLWPLFRIIIALRNNEFQIYWILNEHVERYFSLNIPHYMCFMFIPIQLTWWREQLLNRISQEKEYYNFWNNSPTEGSQDTIIFHIPNEQVGANGKKLCNVILMETHSERVKKIADFFFKRNSGYSWHRFWYGTFWCSRLNITNQLGRIALLVKPPSVAQSRADGFLQLLRI